MLPTRGLYGQELVDRSTLLRALFDVSRHTFPEQRLTRSQSYNGDFFEYTIKVRNYRGDFHFTFQFDRSDWIFDWPNLTSAVTSGDIISRLDWQFDRVQTNFYYSILEENRATAASLQVNPLPLYTKVVIFRQGRYFYKAAIVVNNETRNLRLLVEEGVVVTVSQNQLLLLDPENTLPFGVPLRSS